MTTTSRAVCGNRISIIQILDAETSAIIAQAEAETIEDSVALALQMIPAEAA